MVLTFRKLNDKSVAPTKAHSTDAGYDLTAISAELDNDGNVVYHFGIAMEIPEGYAGLIFPRSSICKKDLALTNAVGVIDAGYRGEITAKFKVAQRVQGVLKSAPNTAVLERNGTARIYAVGERVAQLIIQKVEDVQWQEVNSLGDSERGTSGYGSTGK
jgi:dUTP pyrophosphatase